MIVIDDDDYTCIPMLTIDECPYAYMYACYQCMQLYVCYMTLRQECMYHRDLSFRI